MLRLWFIFCASVFVLGILSKRFLKWLVVPVIIHRKQTSPLDLVFQETRIEKLTPEMRQYLGEQIANLSQEGFEVAANVYAEKATTNTDIIQVLLINRATNDTARLVATASKQARSLTMWITSEFPNGTRITTGATNSATIFPPDPIIDAVNCCWVKDSRILCEMHRRRLIDKKKHDVRRIAPAAGAETSYLTQDYKRERTRIVHCGYWRRDERAGVYRYTWKGAYLATWKSLEPVKSWRQKKRDRQGRREWKRLGMDDWMASDPQATSTSADELPAKINLSIIPELVNPLQTGQLGYEAALRASEIRISHREGQTIVVMGSPSAGAFLRRNGRRLALIGVMVAFLGVQVPLLMRLVSRYRQRPQLSQTLLPQWGMVIFFLALFVGMVAFEIWRLVIDLRRLGSHAVIAASQQGLAYANAPGRRRVGQISRSNIHGLLVRFRRFSGFRKVYILEAVEHRSIRHQLLEGFDRAVLEEAKTQIARAMGIEVGEATSAPSVIPFPQGAGEGS